MTAAPWVDRSARVDAVRPLDRAALADDLRDRVFPSPCPVGPLRIGAEVEVMTVDETTRRPLPLDHNERSVLAMLRRAGATSGWRERRSAKANVPEIALPDGGRITFEPGGQIEISSAPNASVSDLVAGLQATVSAIACAAPHGVSLLSVGIDPVTPLDAVAPQLHADRYRRMLDYFEAIGPSGARMMRQTASFQVCVDGGERPAVTWRVLNALAPYMVAIFANSPRYAGRETGHRSFRRQVWATLDPLRTGLLGIADDPVEEYLALALGAPAFLLPASDGRALPFGDWLDRGVATASDWCTHLSTLFPEVRPRGYYELRSTDAVPPKWFAAPLVLVAGIAYHGPSLDAAADLLGPADEALLARAGRDGLSDPVLRRVAPALCDLALDGCAALGAEFVSGTDLGAAAEYFDRYTRRGLSLADD